MDTVQEIRKSQGKGLKGLCSVCIFFPYKLGVVYFCLLMRFFCQWHGLITSVLVYDNRARDQ